MGQLLIKKVLANVIEPKEKQHNRLDSSSFLAFCRKPWTHAANQYSNACRYYLTHVVFNTSQAGLHDDSSTLQVDHLQTNDITKIIEVHKITTATPTIVYGKEKKTPRE